jgi:hypothetical protein
MECSRMAAPAVNIVRIHPIFPPVCDCLPLLDGCHAHACGWQGPHALWHRRLHPVRAEGRHGVPCATHPRNEARKHPGGPAREVRMCIALVSSPQRRAHGPIDARLHRLDTGVGSVHAFALPALCSHFPK